MASEGIKDRAARLFCYCVYAAMTYVFLKYLLFAIYPILIVLLVSATVSYTAGKASLRTGIPRSVCAVVILSAVIAVLGSGTFYICRRLLLEIGAALGEEESGMIERLFALIGRTRLASVMSYLGERYAEEQVHTFVSALLSSLASVLGALLSRIVMSTPSALFSGVLSVIACYYLSVDFCRITAFVRGVLPRSVYAHVIRLKDGVLDVALECVKGYAILFLIIFTQTLIGLLILCPKYAWLWALFVAAVDVLPLLGAGSVLIPWGIISIISGDVLKGIGLIALFAVISIVRQIIEPFVLGKRMGLHPFASIAAMIVGFRLFGAPGIIIAPVVLAVVLRICASKQKCPSA